MSLVTAKMKEYLPAVGALVFLLLPLLVKTKLVGGIAVVEFPHVQLHRTGLREVPKAFGTFVRLLTGVCHHVPRQVALLGEKLAAFLARVTPLLRTGQHTFISFVRLAHRIAVQVEMARICSLVRLVINFFTHVTIHVRLQLVKPLESIIAQETNVLFSRIRSYNGAML
jgi:hypothetical protein